LGFIYPKFSLKLVSGNFIEALWVSFSAPRMVIIEDVLAN
jgi:hypothetical protein